MIALVAILEAKSGLEEKLEVILREMVPNVEAERGVKIYALHRAQNARGSFLFYEKYVDQTALDEHMSTPYLKKMLENIAPLLACDPKVSFYDEIESIVR